MTLKISKDIEETSDVVVNFLNKINNYIVKYNCNINIELIKIAIGYIQKYHKSQKRHSGAPYYYHPINVASIVIDYFFDNSIIIAALLHDLVEDTHFSLNQIDFLFGKEVSLLVDRLTKIDTNTNMKFKLSDEESSYKLIHLDDNDKKVFAIKLSDRLDNMRTIEYIKSSEKRRKIALETIQVFIPMARYMRLKAIELELQTLAITTLNKN